MTKPIWTDITDRASKLEALMNEESQHEYLQKIVSKKQSEDYIESLHDEFDDILWNNDNDFDVARAIMEERYDLPSQFVDYLNEHGEEIRQNMLEDYYTNQ